MCPFGTYIPNDDTEIAQGRHSRIRQGLLCKHCNNDQASKQAAREPHPYGRGISVQKGHQISPSPHNWDHWIRPYIRNDCQMALCA